MLTSQRVRRLTRGCSGPRPHAALTREAEDVLRFNVAAAEPPSR